MHRDVALSVAVAGLAVVLVLSGQSSAEASSSTPSGKMLFLRCAACHSLSASAPSKVGPHLQGVVGRKSASVAGFAYSPGMRAANLTWNEATLDKWLDKPRTVVANTTMAFAGMPDPAQRKALIAYLKKPTP